MSKMLKVVGASWLQTKISSYILGALGFLAILALFIGLMDRPQEDGTYSATVFYNAKTGYHIEYWGQSNDLAEIPRGVARAYFRMDVNTIGWSTLEIETDGTYSDEIQAYAAGIVEGALTWSLIHSHLDNTIRAKCDDTPLAKQCRKLGDVLDRTANTWRSYASEHKDEPIWHQIHLYYTQINGIYMGWKHGVERKELEYETDISDLFWLNSLSEVAEIQHKLNISVDDSTIDRLPTASSAFLNIVNVKTDDGREKQKLYVAHNAAGSYESMMKILKRYKFNYHLTASNDSAPVPGLSVEFTSYPGSVTSQDEFYKLEGEERKLVVTGTALTNYNNKLWKDVNITEQLPVGPRVTAANRLSTNVSSWGHILATNNSGTGCKQWLVVDFKRFEDISNTDILKDITKSPKKDVITEISIDGKNKNIKHTVVHRSGGGVKGLVWLIEQIPARTHSADITDALLENSYWATHGIPIFKDIYNMTHTHKMEEIYGNIFSESKSQRALTFKKGYVNATSIETIFKLMRQNNMTEVTDSDSKCLDDRLTCVLKNGFWTVLGVRGDLDRDLASAYGVTDTKVVSSNINTSDLDFTALSGPPFTEDLQETETTAINKGNVATVYTDQFDNQPQIDGSEIRDMVKQQQEEALEEYLEEREKHVIQPFQWSDSAFSDVEHTELPDKWAFSPHRVKWSW